MGLRGVVRGRAFETTAVGDELAERPIDPVERQFTAGRRNQLWVSHLTYVATWLGLGLVHEAFRNRVPQRRQPPANPSRFSTRSRERLRAWRLSATS